MARARPMNFSLNTAIWRRRLQMDNSGSEGNEEAVKSTSANSFP